MPTNTNKRLVMTLNELYNFISQIGEEMRKQIIVTVHQNKHAAQPVTHLSLTINNDKKELTLYKHS